MVPITHPSPTLIEASLVNKNDYEPFQPHYMEQIARSIKRIFFPKPKFKIFGLEPESEYMIGIRFNRISNNKFTYRNNEWRATSHGTVLPVSSKICCYQFVQKGKFWMNHELKFKVHLTNKDEEDRADTIFLESMFKYVPVLIVQKKIKNNAGKYELVGDPLEFTFDCLQFMAVTSYRNKKVAEIKASLNIYTPKRRGNNKRRQEVVDDDDEEDDDDQVQDSKRWSQAPSTSFRTASPVTNNRNVPGPSSPDLTPPSSSALIPIAQNVLPASPLLQVPVQFTPNNLPAPQVHHNPTLPQTYDDQNASRSSPFVPIPPPYQDSNLFSQNSFPALTPAIYHVPATLTQSNRPFPLDQHGPIPQPSCSTNPDGSGQSFCAQNALPTAAPFDINSTVSVTQNDLSTPPAHHGPATPHPVNNYAPMSFNQNNHPPPPAHYGQTPPPMNDAPPSFQNPFPTPPPANIYAPVSVTQNYFPPPTAEYGPTPPPARRNHPASPMYPPMAPPRPIIVQNQFAHYPLPPMFHPQIPMMPHPGFQPPMMPPQPMINHPPSAMFYPSLPPMIPPLPPSASSFDPYNPYLPRNPQ